WLDSRQLGSSPRPWSARLLSQNHHCTDSLVVRLNARLQQLSNLYFGKRTISKQITSDEPVVRSPSIADSKRDFIVAERIPGAPVSVLQNRSDEIQCTRILRLSEPEDRFFAHDGVAILARLFDEQRDAFLARHLAQREDRFFLYISIRIVFDGVSDRACCLVSRFLRQPEEGVLADVMPGILTSQRSEVR